MSRYGSGRARANERFDDMKLLELYLARVLMGQILVVLGVLAGIFAFVTFIDQFPTWVPETILSWTPCAMCC